MKFEEIYEKLKEHNNILENFLLKKEIDDKALENIMSDVKSIASQNIEITSQEEAQKLNEIINLIFEKINQLKNLIVENTKQLENQGKALRKYSKY
ncbi:hypothetical protein [Hydrogenivirga sp. 128-5-R1-1]|uniref:hypothetical protein n=1 Tax=Hydrogenivirga sp. 128-5-R1-1 TaxID=392423 RepID=UPI00015F2A9C|nr:hypothetical protein [Hydrogenivirga sp. 128-5-R1-1]EDP73766.1 hypothetical protein HG1285_10056 [Hydrogenivirga sp. 128-5-R1-1]